MTHRRRRVRVAGRARAGPQPRDRRSALLVVAFLVFNPYALLDRHAFWNDGIRKQTEAAGDEGGKLGLANTSGWWYYLTTSTWGFGWLPSLAALGGLGALVARHRRLALHPRPGADPAVPLPRQPVALLRPLDAPGRTRSSACSRPTGSSRSPRGLRRRVLSPRWRRWCSCRGSCSASTTTSCWPRPTPAWSPASGWRENIPIGTKIVMEPIAPGPVGGRRGPPAVRRPAGRDGLGQPLEQVRARRARASSTASCARRAAPSAR